MQLVKFERIGDLAERLVPNVASKVLAYKQQKADELVAILMGQGQKFLLNSLSSLSTRWSQEFFDLQGELAISMYDDGLSLAEELLDDAVSRGKSQNYFSAKVVTKHKPPKGLEPALSFGSNVIGKLQSRGNLSEFLKTHSVITDNTEVKRIAEAVQKNIALAGEGDLSKLISDIRDVVASKHRAELLAHTLTIWSYNQGARKTYENAGIAQMEWMATEDELTCPYCSSLNGNTTDIKVPFLTPGHHNLSSGGVGLNTLHVPWAIWHAPLHPYCRCTQVPIIPDDWAKEYKEAKEAKPKKKFFDFSKKKNVKVNTMLEIDETGFIKGTLVLGEDGQVYEISNDIHGLKVKVFGGGDLDYAYVTPIQQTAKIKKLKIKAIEKFKLSKTKPPEPVVETPPEVVTVAEDKEEKQGENKLSPVESIPVSDISEVEDSTEFPDSLELKDATYKVLKRSMGGSMGAMLIEDSKGRKFILKKSDNWKHLQEEAYADELYNLAGGNAPKSKFYMIGGKGYKLAVYLDGAVSLKDLKLGNPEMFALVKDKIRSQLALNAFLGNNDAIGMDMDNILITFDKKGMPIVWNVDNGGSMRFRAQGAPKQKDSWDVGVGQLWSFRHGSNISTPIFGGMSMDDVASSMNDLLQYKSKILSWIANNPDTQLGEMLRARLDSIEEYKEIGSAMLVDKWKDGYVDLLLQEYMELNRSGLMDKFPVLLNQPGNSKDTNLVDENGKKWDNLRGPNSVTDKWGQFANSRGGNANLVWRWAREQAGSSQSTEAIKTKLWWASQRDVSLENYFWSSSLVGKSEDYIRRNLLVFQSIDDPKYEKTMMMWHAYNIAIAQRIEFPYNNRTEGKVGIIRTESSKAVNLARKKSNGKLDYKQQAYASGSLTNLVSPMGHQSVISLEVPNHRILGYYYCSKGAKDESLFLGTRENEVLYMQEGIDVTLSNKSYNQYSAIPAKPKSQEARRLEKKLKELKENPEAKKRKPRAAEEVVPAIDYDSYRIEMESGTILTKEKVVSFLDEMVDEAVVSFVENSAPHLSEEQFHVLKVWAKLEEPKTSKPVEVSDTKKTKVTSIPDGQIMDVLTGMVGDREILENPNTTFIDAFAEPAASLIQDTDDVEALLNDPQIMSRKFVEAAVEIAKKNNGWTEVPPGKNKGTSANTGTSTSQKKYFGFTNREDAIENLKKLSKQKKGNALYQVISKDKDKFKDAMSLYLITPELQTPEMEKLLDKVKTLHDKREATEVKKKFATKKGGHKAKVKEAAKKVYTWSKTKKYSMSTLEKLDYTGKVEGWKKKGNKKQAYGMVIFNEEGKVLLREPKGHFGGAVWTFAKGGQEPGDSPVKTALKELGEETGHSGVIRDLIPGAFEGTTSVTNYFVGTSGGHNPALMDKETESTKWVTYEEAIELIKMSDKKVAERDLAVLNAAYAVTTSKESNLSKLLNGKKVTVPKPITKDDKEEAEKVLAMKVDKVKNKLSPIAKIISKEVEEHAEIAATEGLDDSYKFKPTPKNIADKEKIKITLPEGRTRTFSKEEFLDYIDSVGSKELTDVLEEIDPWHIPTLAGWFEGKITIGGL